MFRKTLALAACVAAVAVPAFASEGNSTPITTPETSPPCGSHSALHKALAPKNWREKRPLAGVNTRCIAPRHIAKHRRSLRLYRKYRSVAPYRCHGGAEGYYAIPCYIIACESHFNWFALNGSGAAGVYQLMPEWDRPYPARTFKQRLANHRIAAGLSLSNWVCA